MRGSLVDVPPVAICGNGVIDGADECDDGGTTSGDGCNASCTIESGWQCSGQPSACSLIPPTLSSLGQFAVDKTTAVEAGGVQNDGIYWLQGTVTSATGGDVQLEVEVTNLDKDAGDPSRVKTFTSDAVNSGSPAGVEVVRLGGAHYSWRARAIEAGGGLSSDWQEFNGTTGTDFAAPTKNPVVIIPGIMGSELYDGNEKAWFQFTPPSSMVLPSNGVLPEDENGHPIDNLDAKSVIKSIPFFVNIFGDLEAGLGDGRDEGENLFYFPYDWRLDIDVSARLLEDKIDAVLNQTDAPKADVVAHSMGGLLAKDYLKDYQEDHPSSPMKVDKLIFVGTPHRGAPKASAALLWGDTEIPLMDKEMAKSISHNSPSAHELLPSPSYLQHASSYLYKTVYVGNPTGVYGVDWTMSFDAQDFDDSMSLLTDAGAVNADVVGKALSFWEKDLDNVDLSGVDAYDFAGCETRTVSGYWLNRFGDVVKLGYSMGDGTVPLVSASAVSVPAGHKFYVKSGLLLNGATHSELPSANGVRQAIAELLSGQSVVPSDYLSVSPDDCHLPLNYRSLQIMSPVSADVYDSSGNHAGPTLDGGFENNIPGASYEIVGHRKFILLPTDDGQTYQVDAVGTDDGTFDMRLVDYGEEGVSSTIFNDVPVNTSDSFSFNLSASSSPTSLQITDNDDVTRSVVADVTSAGDLTEDIVPPVTSAGLGGLAGVNGWFVGGVAVTLSALEEEGGSGVASVMYSLDGGATFQEYSTPFAVVTEGESEVVYYSVDQAGNNEETKTFEVKIDRLAPSAVSFDPPQGMAVSGEVLAVTVVATDAGSGVAAVTVAGLACQQQGGSWVCVGVPNVPGPDSYDIEITDEAGNVAYATLHTVDSTGTGVTCTEGEGGDVTCDIFAQGYGGAAGRGREYLTVSVGGGAPEFVFVGACSKTTGLCGPFAGVVDAGRCAANPGAILTYAARLVDATDQSESLDEVITQVACGGAPAPVASLSCRESGGDVGCVFGAEEWAGEADQGRVELAVSAGGGFEPVGTSLCDDLTGICGPTPHVDLNRCRSNPSVVLSYRARLFSLTAPFVTLAEASVDVICPAEFQPLPDDEAPVTTASLSGDAGQDGWYRSDVAVTLGTQDASVTFVEYSLDGGVAWFAYAAPVAVADEGVASVLYRATDEYGNAEGQQSVEIKIDKTGPTVSVASPVDASVTGDTAVPVSGAAADWGSGLASVSVGGAACSVEQGAWSCADVPLAVGANVLTATALDLAGNATTASVTVTRTPPPDTVPPVTVATLAGTIGDGDWYQSDVTITLSASDDEGGSGVALTEYSLDGGSTWAEYLAPATVGGNGAHEFSYRSRDAADNQETTQALVVNIDSADPELAVVIPSDRASVQAADLAVSGTASDAGSGLSSVSVNGVACTLDGGDWSCSAVPLDEGPNDVVATVTDAAGNEAAATLTVFRPAASLSCSEGSGDVACSYGAVGFAGEEGDGRADLAVSTDSGQTYSALEARTCDAAGTCAVAPYADVGRCMANPGVTLKYRSTLYDFLNPTAILASKEVEVACQGE